MMEVDDDLFEENRAKTRPRVIDRRNRRVGTDQRNEFVCNLTAVDAGTIVGIVLILNLQKELRNVIGRFRLELRDLRSGLEL